VYLGVSTCIAALGWLNGVGNGVSVVWHSNGLSYWAMGQVLRRQAVVGALLARYAMKSLFLEWMGFKFH
jgi:hypothetical protein